MNDKIVEKVEVFCKYQKNFFLKEATGKKTIEYITGYTTAIKDILNLIEYEKKILLNQRNLLYMSARRNYFFLHKV